MAAFAPSFPLKRAGLAAGAFLFFAGIAVAGAPVLTTVSGAAIVIDGDTIEIAGEHVRLEGIDAPETAQTCRDANGADWNCGYDAARALAKLTGGSDVSCDRTGTDKYGRTLAICYANGLEINAEMVRSGMARAFVKYSVLYLNEEQAAAQAGRGIWQGPSEAPWDFRHNAGGRSAGAASTTTCAIKGNVSPKGMIYHVPQGPWYDKVKIDEQRGERWFCSEAEAVRAGWRAALLN